MHPAIQSDFGEQYARRPLDKRKTKNATKYAPSVPQTPRNLEMLFIAIGEATPNAAAMHIVRVTSTLSVVRFFMYFDDSDYFRVIF
jgi:hypothetical protein